MPIASELTWINLPHPEPVHTPVMDWPMLALLPALLVLGLAIYVSKAPLA
jgi:hypothetical protein